MKTKIQILLLTIIISPISIFASWNVYPWTLKTTNNIKIESIPYRIYEGGDLGVTKVYKRKTLLYSIEEYFSNFVVINKTGEYFVSINFQLNRTGHRIIEVDENGKRIPKIEKFVGEAIKIFKNGKLVKTIDFVELQIDTSQLIKRYNQFYWHSTNELISKCPAIIKNNILKIATIDNQVFIIDLSTLEQLEAEIFETGMISDFVRFLPKRKLKVKRKGFPDKFLLPNLIDGKTIEIALSEYLKLEPSETDWDSALVKIYVHTLLINSEGKCEKCYVSPTKRKSIEIEFGYNYDTELKKKIEDWISKQKFDTRLIPKYTDKYVFSNFVYLK